MNKRQFYNSDRMWISWKLMFKEGGFAFIVFGNQKGNNKKFHVKFTSK
jgi:hypothetical protein